VTEDQVSLTAIMTSYIRAYHSRFGQPKIFDDFLAYPFLPADRRILIENGLLDALNLDHGDLSTLGPQQHAALAGMLQAMGASNVLSRSRYAEDTLLRAVKEGIKQYVILGAGMDTFAFRHPEMAEQLHVFEVDHPATQAFKRARLAELGWQQPLHLHFVPVDFTKDDLAAALSASMFDPQVKSFFSWLGVTMYLTLEQVLATLSSIAHNTAAGSLVIFDYHDTDFAHQAASHMQASFAREAGESMYSIFDPSELARELATIGLHLNEDLSPAEIDNRYFGNRADGYKATPCTHLACAVVV
jgi:methyltransferase (TIGR00027 family)